MQPKILRTIIVDDEMPSREALVTYIRDFCTGVEIVAECDSIKSAFHAIQKFQPHLVFLDIEMPNGSGFDLLQLFKNPSFKVIFVTAFSDYAIRAFRFSAVDYLLKPVKVDELIEAVDKVKKDFPGANDNQNLLNLMGSLNANGQNYQKLVIPNNKGFVVINVADIIMCQADGYLTHFFLTENRKVHGTKSLKYYEEIFEKGSLFRVHRSYLVNLTHVKGYSHLGEIKLTDNLSCPLSDSFKNKFIECLTI